ncbi:hypothetical protein GQ43DRAFT_37033 [Delitschia confertaspora ATCC 74209]|uniref:Origin recognition complex subunit n=1 Tax=Delitschia confertaspora ATCC 74209 TaxID=1513339 RepID=A0A9P4JNI4_9PLEO|nr:hypothetical protein GQ43DRAFT_37033 [Delitschia confertaspora ATCC 74209]
MEHERCYIYTPPQSEERAAKRRRTDSSNHQAQLSARLDIYRELWAQQEERIHATLEEADRSTLENIVNFISSPSRNHDQGLTCILTGLIIAGPSIASHGPFFDRLGRKIRNETNSAYILLTSGECPNLKSLLKNLIKKVTSRTEDDDDDDIAQGVSSRRGPKVLDFDLQHVQEWQTRNHVEKIVVAVQDSEAFDAGLLAEVIDLFHSWLDRLPFVLLFGIATSAESFEDRLSGRALRYLEGEKFNVTQTDKVIETLFGATVASTDVPLRIGPNLSRRMLDRQKDYVQNVQDLSDGLKYAYMSHFYANCTSIFLKKDITFKELPKEVLEAVRNLPSFRKWVELLLDSRKTQEVRKLLDSDEHLFETVKANVISGQEVLAAVTAAVIVLVRLREALQMTSQVPLSSIWIRAASGELAESPLLRETMLSIKKVSSDKLGQVLASFKAAESIYLPVDISAFQNALEDLLKQKTDSTPLRTQDDVRTNSLRTTVVAQKVELSKHKAALSEQDKLYSELIARLHDDLENYFNGTFIDPKELFLSEILIYDLRSPLTEVFQPKPRFAIERALGSPHDYLGCDCCSAAGDKGAEAALSATQPATAILYQLYLESGSLINVADLWAAFNAITGEEGEDNDHKTMALFQRALAELRYLGFVKPSRKKTDHVTKMLWKGL